MRNQSSLYTETLKDKFTFSPLQKYQKYGRWPYKMVIGCVLVVLTSIQSIFVSNHFIYNNPELMKTWGNDEPQIDSNVLYTVAEFQDSFSQTLINLKNLQEIAVVPISIKSVQLSLHVQFKYPNIIYNTKEQKFIYPLEIGQDITEPFLLDDTLSIRRFWQKAEAFILDIRNITVFDAKVPSCWDIQIHYKYQDQGVIVAKVDSIGGVCKSDYKILEIKNGVDANYGHSQSIFINGGVGWNESLLQISIILLATLDLVLNLKYIYEVVEMYTRNIYLQTRIHKVRIPEYKMKKDENLTTLKIILKQQKPWSQLSFRERMLFFDLFLPIRIIGNSFQILSSGIILAEGFFRVDDLANYDESLVGIGCFMAWFSIAKYMEYIQQLHLITSVLESSIIPLCMAVISFIPVFMAYIFLGMCLFSDSSRFATLHSSFVTLTALVYGDSVSDIVLETSMQQNLKMVLIYIITYVLLFTFAVNNIMVALIKEQQEQRKEVIDLENELMNELDIKPATQFSQSGVGAKMVQSVIVVEQSEQSSSITLKEEDRFGAESSISPQRPEMLFQSVPRQAQSVRDLDEAEKRKHISLKTVSKIAVLLSRNSGKRLSQKRLESDWSRLAGQEIKKNQLYQSISELGQDIKFQLQQMENELRSELSLFSLNRIERIEVTTYYCSQLIALTGRIKEVTYKIMVVEKQLQTEEAEYKRSSIQTNNRRSSKKGD